MIGKILIVGAGTAGFVSALILKTRFPNIDISIVRSKNIGIIGVGEGTTEHWHHFMQMVGIDPTTLINRTDATLKYGVMFEDWTKQPYLHSIPDNLNNIRIGQYPAGYGYLISKQVPADNLTLKNIWNKEIVNSEQPYQYHFNTNKLNTFLEEISVSRNIKIIDDEIHEVVTENNTIQKVVGTENYTADFYIDCTGFKRLLINKLGAKWKSYSKWLTMNEAIAFPTKDTQEYNPYTLAKAMSSGWLWRIPVWGRWGNGYVFDSNYISADQAKQEAEEYLGFEIDVARHIKFDPGCLEKSWIGNCSAIGLSSNFVEPLEATSIGSTINQTFLLMHYIPNYNEHSINLYNKKVNLILENIRDFVITHYLTKKTDSKFWQDVQNIELPESLRNNLLRWKNNLPIKEDVVTTEYVLFHEQNWINLLYGIGWFEQNIKQEYEMINQQYKDHVENKVDSFINAMHSGHKHKDFIRRIREQ